MGKGWKADKKGDTDREGKPPAGMRNGLERRLGIRKESASWNAEWAAKRVTDDE